MRFIPFLLFVAAVTAVSPAGTGEEMAALEHFYPDPEDTEFSFDNIKGVKDATATKGSQMDNAMNYNRFYKENDANVANTNPQKPENFINPHLPNKKTVLP